MRKAEVSERAIKIKLYWPIFFAVKIGTNTRIFWLPRFARWPSRALAILRECLPMFWAVGAHCCDHGGQVRRWYPLVTFNYWHAKRISRRGDIGDGPDMWSRISFKKWCIWRFNLWRANKSSQHIDDVLLGGAE